MMLFENISKNEILRHLMVKMTKIVINSVHFLFQKENCKTSINMYGTSLKGGFKTGLH